MTLEKRQAKKDVVLGTEKKGRLPLIVAIVCTVLIVGGGIYYAGYDRSETAPVVASFTSENNASQVSLPASLFEDGKARHFQHVAGEFNFTGSEFWCSLKERGRMTDAPPDPWSSLKTTF